MFSISLVLILSQTPQFMTPATMGDKFVLLMVLFVIQIRICCFSVYYSKFLKKYKCITLVLKITYFIEVLNF
jgi:hypothetical protein